MSAKKTKSKQSENETTAVAPGAAATPKAPAAAAAAPEPILPSSLIGPEDVEVGMFVTLSETTHQFMPLDEMVGGNGSGPSGGAAARTLEPMQITMIAPGAGWPLRVVDVCLPFVFLVNAKGEHSAADLRRHRLAKLSARYGRITFAAQQPKRKKAAKKAHKKKGGKK